MTDHDPALVEKVATTLWSLECRTAEALHDEPLEVHNGFWRDARAVLNAVADDIARAERERVLAEVEALADDVLFAEDDNGSSFILRTTYAHKVRALVARLRGGAS